MRISPERLLALLVLVLGVSSPLSAQQQPAPRGAISGRVILANTGEPARQAQVFLAGTSIGQLTNADGRFMMLNVPVGAYAIRVQTVGYADAEQTLTVTSGSTTVANFELKQQAVQIQAIVVTAMGMERKEKSLGYSVQTVSTAKLERSPEVTLINALSGQTAGVSVISNSGQPGSSATIRIRGEASFSGGGQPLFVIDGMPITVAMDTRSANALEYGAGVGDRGMDIDPNIIEEISILRGAAATALYGSRAAFGAVVIKTKQGRPGQPVRINASSMVTVDRPILAGKQELYAQGMDGYYCNGRLREQGGWCQPGYPGTDPNPVSINQWGPHQDSIPQIVLDSMGEVRFRDPRKDYYQTGRTLSNSVTMSGSLPTGGYNFTVSHLNQTGITPGSLLNRLNIGANVNAMLSTWLRSETNLQYSNSLNRQANEGYSSATRTLFQMPMTRDISQAWMPDGSPVMLDAGTPHPVWATENSLTESNTPRWIASQKLSFLLMSGLTLQNRFGVDTYTDERTAYNNEQPWRTIQGQTSGSTDQGRVSRLQINNDMHLVLETRRLLDGRLGVGGLLGGNINARRNNSMSVSGSTILVPGTYGVSNFLNQSVSGSLSTKQRMVGVMGELDLDYNDVAFLTLTGRNDWSSTLPTENNSYFYPSASFSLVFTDAFGFSNDILQYGKLRISRSKVGADAGPYLLDTRYATASGSAAGNMQQQYPCCALSFPIPQQGGVVAYRQSNSLGNPDLRPESTVENEVGIELRFFDSRVQTNVTYYDKKSYDQIFSVPSSAVTGYTSITRNAGNLKNQGWEVSVNTAPVRGRNVAWYLDANWSRNRNSVESLAPGVSSIFIAGYSWPQIRIMEGYPYGVIWGYGYQRNEQGQLLVGDDGWPLLDENLKVLGTAMGDWNANLSTSLRYRAFTFSTQVERSQGGDILNFDLQYTVSNGIAKRTEKRSDAYTFEGVNANTGQPNDVQLIRDRRFWAKYNSYDLHENQVEKDAATATRIREARIEYRVPATLSGKIGAENLRLYFTGRNLKVWSPFSGGDPQTNNYGSSNSAGAAFKMFPGPQARSYVFGMRAEI